MRLVANLVALAALAGVIAFWGWRWLGPAPEPLVRTPVDDVAAALAVSPPFGVATDTAPASRVSAQPAPGDARLLGVLAEPGGGGRALFRMPDGSARLAWTGESLGEVGTLVAVHPDGVTLRGPAGERALPLRTVAAPGSPRASVNASCVPPGYRGPVVRLNGELLAGLIQQPGSLAAVAEPKDGALVVLDESGFAGMLGLRKGDRVAQANGIALRTTDDVVLAILRPLAANQAVRVIGQRGNAPREFVIVNASACSG